jgi:hypothetical protein
MKRTVPYLQLVGDGPGTRTGLDVLPRRAHDEADSAVEKLLADFAPKNSLAALAVDEDMDLPPQGDGGTGGAPRVARAAGRADRHPLGIAITIVVAVALVVTGVSVAVSVPALSGGHLGALVLVAAGGALAARLAHVQLGGAR